MNIEELIQKYKEQISELFFKWKVFSDLYDSGDESIAALNKACSLVFSLLQDLLYKEIFLSISKLTDSAYMKKDADLSFKYLLEQIKTYVNADTYDFINLSINELEKYHQILRNIEIKKSHILI